MDSVSDICKYHFTVLHDHNRGQGHVRSPGKKKVKQKKFRDLELRYMFFRSDFRKERETWP